MQLVEELLPNMRRVSAADRDLRDLGLLWTMIESSSAISCPEDAESILPTLSQTRERFAELQTRLVTQLGKESLAELADELSATAQCSIDILVRNLFERTADVGFLATDEPLRTFCAATAEQRAKTREAVVRRLAEYRAKYTVYDDIIVLSPAGEVLARLDDESSLGASSDAAIQQALARTGYVERHGLSDLGSGEQAALLYAHRIDDGHGRPLGVLVLRFRLADEMQHIFGQVTRAQRPVAVLLLDASGRVVLSNDEAHVPLGSQLAAMPEGVVSLTAFAGREYLGVTCPTRGYQGYRGPGWRAVAMVSLQIAFRSRHEDVEHQDGVSLDNDELQRIQSDVDAINRNLRRVVWNGRLQANSRAGGRAQIKAILQQVNDAGARMRDRAGRAIRDLYRTSLGRAQQQAAELARLAADIMDRNLYERANDCRWWALSPVLQSVLSAGVDARGTEQLNAVLSHINGLYTVYTRLVVFDASGTICGASNEDAEKPLLGSTIDAEALAATLALADSQRYAVSPFRATPLNGGVPTYVFLAAVRSPSGGQPLGGIAIVFDAAREFSAMLRDVLDGRPGLAAFVDDAGRVLASTAAEHVIGQPIGAELSKHVIEYQGANFALASALAVGYREFKCTDGYQNHIRAVVALRLGALERRRASLFDQSLRALPHGAQRRAREFALFQVGPSRYALPVTAVLEARSQQGLVRTARISPHVIGLMEVGQGRTAGVVPVLCGRSLFGLAYPSRAFDGTVLVMADPDEPGRPLFGFRVDDVISVLDIDELHIHAAPAGMRHHAPWLAAMVRLMASGEPSEEVLAQLMDPDALVRLVRPSHEITAAAEAAANADS